MNIEKVKIHNFKCFKDFTITFKHGMNIIVGNNEVGKSTILEAINLALTGYYKNTHISKCLSQYMFNKDILDSYFKDPNSYIPELWIEVYFEKNSYACFRGNNNSDKDDDAEGFVFSIKFNNDFQNDYIDSIRDKSVRSLPLEYYDIKWSTFSRDSIKPRSIPYKSYFIDASNRVNSNNDIYLTRILNNYLDINDKAMITHVQRKLLESFIKDDEIVKINKKLDDCNTLVEKNITIAPDFVDKQSWLKNIITEVDDIPFIFIGSGDQSIIKTEVALNQIPNDVNSIILIEEPENHLSYSRLNKFLSRVNDSIDNNQLVISSHSNFVVNKLGIDKVSLIYNQKIMKFENLQPETANFFKKLPGFDTLRMVLSKSVILCEGPSDELVLQKAYYDKYNKLPIEDEIDIISVGTSFLRFLEIAEHLDINIAVVTDNDGDLNALEKKYEKYINSDKYNNIYISYDATVDDGKLNNSNNKFNYNTLEPKLLKANNIDMLNDIFSSEFKTDEDLLKYMNKNKTDCMLKVFESDKNIVFPNYINEAIEWVAN